MSTENKTAWQGCAPTPILPKTALALTVSPKTGTCFLLLDNDGNQIATLPDFVYLDDQGKRVDGHTLKIAQVLAAAPDLLEALRVCEGNISSLLASNHPKIYGEWLAVVRAAIAKAEGAA